MPPWLKKIFYIMKSIAYAVLPGLLYQKLSGLAKKILKWKQSIPPEVLAKRFQKQKKTRKKKFSFICQSTVVDRKAYTFNEGKLQFTDKHKVPQPEKCRLVICCAFLGRHEILKQAVLESFSSQYAEDVRWVLVGSTEEDDRFIQALARETKRISGFAYDIQPLGKKWQASVKIAQQLYDAELLAITGSDDILSHQLINHVIQRHQSNLKKSPDPEFLPSMYCCMEWLVLQRNIKHELWGEFFKCHYRYETALQPLGAGRFYPCNFLRKLDYFIFDSDKNRLLDDDGFFAVRDRKGFLEYVSLAEGPVISVKGDWLQLNSLDDLIKAPTVNVQEYSFEGYRLLQSALSETTLNYLFRTSKISDQPTGVPVSEPTPLTQ